MGLGLGAFFSLMSSSFTYEDPLRRNPNFDAMPFKGKASIMFRDMGRGMWTTGKGFGKVGALYSGLECCVEGVSRHFGSLGPHSHGSADGVCPGLAVPSKERPDQLCRRGRSRRRRPRASQRPQSNGLGRCRFRRLQRCDRCVHAKRSARRRLVGFRLRTCQVSATSSVRRLILFLCSQSAHAKRW